MTAIRRRCKNSLAFIGTRLVIGYITVDLREGYGDGLGS
jgi:hypothetical protein